MKNRTISLLFAFFMIVLLLSLLAITAFADGIVDSGGCGHSTSDITWSLDTKGTRTISGTEKMKDHSSYSDMPWYNYNSSIYSLNIGNGITAFTDETETPIVPTDSGVEINGLNLTLSGEIGLTYHVYVPKKYRNGTMELKFMDEEPIRMNIADCPKDENLRYTATYYLSAIELSEPVTLTVYDKDGIPLAEESRSAEEYAKLLVEDRKAADVEKVIAKTLINYGHYAQLVCSKANGWVIGEDYAETTAFYAPNVDTSVFSRYAFDWNTDSAELNHLSMSLRFDYKTSIMLYIPVEEQPTVKVNGETAEVVPSERAENTYQIEISGINALSLADEYTVEINDLTLRLCAFGYCNLAIQHNASQNTIDAMRAMYEFYEAMVEYNTPAQEV